MNYIFSPSNSAPATVQLFVTNKSKFIVVIVPNKSKYVQQYKNQVFVKKTLAEFVSVSFQFSHTFVFTFPGH